VRAAGLPRLLLLVLLLPAAAGQTTSSTNTSSSVTWHHDPVTGHGEDLAVANVTRSTAGLYWTWVKGCSETVLLVLSPQGVYDGNGSALQLRHELPAVDGPMAHEAGGLWAGTTYDAYVVAAHHCGLGSSASNEVTFTTIEGPADHGDDAVGATALLLALLGAVLLVRRRL
jgi:hypothetical protein